LAGVSLEANMRQVLTALALGCAFVVALSVAASACDYKKSTASNSDNAAQTAQSQSTPTDN
jgi:hypothetical protein